MSHSGRASLIQAIGPFLLLLSLMWLPSNAAHAQDCGQALDDAQQMVDAFPDDPQAFETLGEAQVCKAQCVDAWGTLSKAVEMGSPASVMGAAETCMKRLVVNGTCEDATAQARKLVEIAPKSALAHTILAQALTCQSGCAERLVVLSKAVQLGASSDLLKDPDLSCIDTLIEQKACSAALDEISQALTVLPKSASLYMSQARAQICAGECASAWDSFDRAGRLGADTSDHREAQQCMATLIQSGDCEASQAQATQIVRGHTKSMEAQAIYASAMVCSGSCVESFIAWDKAVRLGGPESLATKGTSCLESMMNAGRCEDVTSEVQALLKAFPKNAELYALLGDSQTCQEDCIGAWKSYGKAGSYGASAETAGGGAQCLASLIQGGQCDKALDQAFALAKGSPKNPEPVWAMAEAKLCSKDYRGALGDFQLFESRGGDAERAAEGIARSRSHLASLTIRVLAAEEGMKLPTPTIEGIEPDQIRSKGGGVYEALDINPTAVKVSIAPGDGFWPIERTLRLRGGSVEEVELTVMRAVFSSVKVGEFSSELELSLLDPRSGELLALESGSELEIPAGPSRIDARLPAGPEQATLELSVELAEGAQQLALPWGWRVVDPVSGQVMSSGISSDKSASLAFNAELPISFRPTPVAGHESVITGSPGQVLDYQMNLESHPSFAAFDAMKAYQGTGRRHRLAHWGLLGAAVLLEGAAVAQFGSAMSEAERARGITNPRLADDYADAVSSSRRAQGVSLGLAIAGGAVIGTSIKVTRPNIRGRSETEAKLKTELMEAIQAPIEIESIDSRAFDEKTALFDPSRASRVPTRPSTDVDTLPVDSATADDASLSPLEDLDEDSTRRVRTEATESDERIAVSLGLTLAPLRTYDAPELGLVWTVPGGTMPRFVLRAERPLSSRLSVTANLAASPAYPIINDGGESFTESLFTVGARYSWRAVGPVEIAPLVGLGGLNRKVAPEGEFDLHTINPVIEAGVQLQLPLGSLPIAATADITQLKDLSELSSDGNLYVSSSGIQLMFGVRAGF